MVAFHRQQVVRVTVLDEVAGVVLLRVHRVHRDHGLAQVRVVDGVQERGELRNLVGLRADHLCTFTRTWLCT